MNDTLLIWQSEEGVKLYLIPEPFGRVYECCNGTLLNGSADEDLDIPIDISDRIQYLAALIGVELFFGAEHLPDFETFRRAIGYDHDVSVEKPAKSTWARFEIPFSGVAVDGKTFPFKTVVKVIRTGWMF